MDLKKLRTDTASSSEVQQDTVNHPKHYQGKYECIEVMRALFGDEAVMAFCKCNIFKYRFRADKKNKEEDIKKAEYYEGYLMDMLKAQKAAQSSNETSTEPTNPS